MDEYIIESIKDNLYDIEAKLRIIETRAKEIKEVKQNGKRRK